MTLGACDEQASSSRLAARQPISRAREATGSQPPTFPRCKGRLRVHTTQALHTPTVHPNQAADNEWSVENLCRRRRFSAREANLCKSALGGS